MNSFTSLTPNFKHFLMKKKIIFACIVFVLITVSSQIIFHLDIKRQAYDAELINISGKQRMYSQQITKIALYANEVKDLYRYYIDLDDLSDIIDDFSHDNYYVKNVNNTKYNDPEIDTLFERNQVYFKNIVNAANETIDNPENQEIFKKFVATVKANEKDFLVTMDALVNKYQEISERKIAGFQKLLFIYGAISFLFLAFVVFSILIPAYKKKKRKFFT